MYNKVRKYIIENGMLDNCRNVVIGLSGGADSVCLALILNEYAKEAGFDITAVHIHHGIRGEEADHDAKFCRQFAIDNNIRYVERHFDVPSYAASHGLSSEEAGRILRYETFNSICSKLDNSVIAVAHHMNDQAETVLFNLGRGSGLGGIKGMLPVNGNVIRPLIICGRDEIEKYLKDRNVSYCVDSTNATNEYSRNIIRNRIIPLFKEVNDNAVGNIASAAAMAAEAERFLVDYTDKIYEDYVKSTGDGYIFVYTPFIDGYIVKRVIRKLLGMVAGGLKDITSAHVNSAYELYCSESGHSINVRKDIVVKKEQDGLFFSNCNMSGHGGDGHSADDFTMEVIPWDGSEKISNDIYTKLFDYDKIKSKLCIRTRMDGDYLQIDSTGHCKKLNQYFIDEKIPLRNRDKVQLLADGSHIMWVIGYRISAAYKIDERTTKVLKVHYGGKHNGES